MMNFYGDFSLNEDLFKGSSTLLGIIYLFIYFILFYLFIFFIYLFIFFFSDSSFTVCLKDLYMRFNGILFLFSKTVGKFYSYQLR